MEKTILSMELASTPISEILFSVTLDGQEIFSGNCEKLPEKLTYEFDSVDNRPHELCFIMSGKTSEHTKIDQDGTIQQDALISIKNIAFDEIVIDKLVWELSKYHHDFNGTRDPVVDKFYGDMGCNGKVSLDFTTPVYIWLLENM